MESNVMDTATAELVYQTVSVVISVILTAISAYAIKWFNTSSFAKKYELDNGIAERVITNAVIYAEKYGKKYAYDGVKKRELANKYIDTVKPELIREYGDKLDIMLDRKVAELVGYVGEKETAVPAK